VSLLSRDVTNNFKNGGDRDNGVTDMVDLQFSSLYVLFCLVDYSKMLVSVQFQKCRRDARTADTIV
jgi:hypothetical protein